MTSVIGLISAEQRLVIEPTSVSAFHRRLFSYEDEFNKRGIGKIYMLFAGWEGRIVKNCDRGLENAARGRRPRAAFSSPRSQFFTIRTDPKPANNLFIFSCDKLALRNFELVTLLLNWLTCRLQTIAKI